MKDLLNFGISQEDARTELAALELQKGDRLLTVSSAGEVPLNLGALADVSITAVDTSKAQLFLTKLKLSAALNLEPADAAGMLGYVDVPQTERKTAFDHLRDKLPKDERDFWDDKKSWVLSGIVGQARFEKYVKRYLPIGSSIIGKKHIRALLEMDSVEEQKQYFDEKFRTGLLQLLFNVAFHPKIYKTRGMAEKGLTHSGQRNIAAFFYSRFRDFCTANLARENYYYQYMLLGKITDSRGLPEYLTEKGARQLRRTASSFEFKHIEYDKMITETPDATFNKFHLSNIGDWMSTDAFAGLQRAIARHAQSDSKGVLRYIHMSHAVPELTEGSIVQNLQNGLELIEKDRFPFYTVVPFDINPTRKGVA